ncbi:MAG TPA: sucrase ferredoxin, partial [Nocardioides sp.]
GPPRVVLAARRTADGFAVDRLLVDDLRTLLDLDPVALAAGHLAGAAPYADPLWLVCTNGRRDLCCAELGRPVAAALAARWPEATWETTHLGGHRFSATLLALPTGVALGRLDPSGAVAACADLVAGRLPLPVTRGRAGLPVPAQVAETALRRELTLDGLDDVAVRDVGDGWVDLEVRRPPAPTRWRAAITSRPGEPRPASCGDATAKAAPVHEVRLRPLAG